MGWIRSKGHSYREGIINCMSMECIAQKQTLMSHGA